MTNSYIIYSWSYESAIVLPKNKNMENGVWGGSGEVSEKAFAIAHPLKIWRSKRRQVHLPWKFGSTITMDGVFKYVFQRPTD